MAGASDVGIRVNATFFAFPFINVDELGGQSIVNITGRCNDFLDTNIQSGKAKEFWRQDFRRGTNGRPLSHHCTSLSQHDLSKRNGKRFLDQKTRFDYRRSGVPRRLGSPKTDATGLQRYFRREKSGL